MSTSALSIENPFDHPLLTAAGCPPSGNGAPVYLQQLARSLEACQALGVGASTQEWLRIVRHLSRAVTVDARKASASPKAADLEHQPWGGLHGCIEARGLVKTQSTKYLDTLFVHFVLEAAASRHQLTDAALQGLRTCYIALAGRRKLHAEWSLLTTPALIERSQLVNLLEGLAHPPVRALGKLVLGLLEQPMPTPAGIAEWGVQNQKPSLDSVSCDNPEEGKSDPGLSATSSGVDAIEGQENPEPSLPKFARGDSIIGWHIKRASNAPRNDRLALESWTSLPIEQTCQIAARLPTLLTDVSSPWHRAAVIATTSLLTSTPGHVLLHANVNRDVDLNIDLDHQRFSWTMPSLRGEPNMADPNRNSTKIAVPFPMPLAQAIAGLAHGKNVNALRHFSDVFGVDVDTAAWDALLRQTHDLLMELSDPAFPAFPGRWANSLSRVYLDSCGSDLMASVCSLDLALTPQAALYYFHPSEQDIRQSVNEVYERLGVGPCGPATEVAHERDIPSDEHIAAGFTDMEARADALQALILNRRTNLTSSIHNLNELTQLTAALTTFLVGGRGSRVEEITCGALYCASDCWWLEDKKVEHENSSRILPKPKHLRQGLHRLFIARKAVAERLSSRLRRDLAERWKELASGQLRFDAPVFEYLDFSSEKVTKSAVTAAEIEAVSQRFFSAGKNFMRHVLITHWALDGEDPHLLRVITGHATAGLALPAAGAMYTPESATQAAGVLLENLLKKWLPDIGAKASVPDPYKFFAMPGRRVLKVHNAHRENIEKWDAPVFSRWHLAAVRIMDRVRELLMNGHGPNHPHARLWLHLVSFDALNEPIDLESIFEDINASFELGSTGWVAKFKRSNSKHVLVTPVQLPTAILLSQHRQNAEIKPSAYSEVLEAAEKWIGEAIADCWGGEKVGVGKALLACSRLWADWCLPPATQLCYSPTSCAPVLDSHSNANLFGLKASQGTEPPARPRHVLRTTTDLFSAFYKVVNRLGSSRHKLGEQKKRAQLFDRWVSLSRIPTEGELTCTLVRVVSVNATRIRASKRNAIEWSSQATYLSTLRPFLTMARNLDPDAFDAQEWVEFCRDLLAFSHADEKQTVTATEASEWIMGCLRELGHPLPSRADLTQIKRYPVATATTAIAAFTQEQLDQAALMLISSQDGPLRQARIQLAIKLLGSLPMRWSELATAAVSDATADGAICITSRGYAHLKSHAARRRLALTEEHLRELTSLIQQIEELKTHGVPEALIFGSRTLHDGTQTVDSAWIRSAITAAVQSVARNPSFRIHAFRAHVVSHLLLPDWRWATKPPQPRVTGPRATSALFGYQKHRAWATDVVRLCAGHASVQTTLSYYFHAWLPVRALALRATLIRHGPTEHLLNQLGVSTAALTKARLRDQRYQDPWEYLQSKLPVGTTKDKSQTLPPIAAFKDVSAANNATIAAESHVLPVWTPAWGGALTSTEFPLPPQVTYLGIRMLGIDQRTANNMLGGLQRQVVDDLESRLVLSNLSSETLRGRIKGDITGRAMAADIRQLQSPQAHDLITVLSGIPTVQLRMLLQLLLPRHELVHWEDEIIAAAPWLEKSQICLEVVSDIRRVDPALNIQLSKLDAVLIGPPAHDIGSLPRIFIQPRDPTARNTVAKARWTTLVRVLANALLVLRTSRQ